MAAGLLGAGLLVVAAFLPAYRPPPHFVPAVRSLWDSGPGWTIAGAGMLVAVLSLRAYRRGRASWSGLWVGALLLPVSVLIATPHICNLRYVCPRAAAGPGIYVLAAGSLMLLVGWALGFRSVRARSVSSQGPEAPAWAEARPAPLAMSLRSASVWSLGLYLTLSVLLLGLGVLGHFSSKIVAQDDGDPSAYMWFFAWWPHAVLHGLNPLDARTIFVPDGFNLAWATPVPGPSLVLAPVTLAFGPIATWNVLALLTPALDAWAAFLLCRYLTRRTEASLVAGFIFGFSPYVMRELGGPNLALAPLVPVLVLLVVRRLDGALDARRFSILAALALVAQGLIGMEILVTLTVFGVIALLAAYGLFPELRPALGRTAGLLALAYAAAAVLLSPVLFYMAFRAHPALNQATAAFTTDLADLVRAGSSALPFHGASHRAPPGRPGYLGFPLVLIIAVFAWQHRRSRKTRLLLICFLVPLVASLGASLRVDGTYAGIGLPWAVFDVLPGLKYAIPQRFSVFAVLAAAVIVAIWMSSHRSALTRPMAALAVAFFAANAAVAHWRYPVSNPSLVASGLHRQYLQADDRVFVVPNTHGARWQALAGFGFGLAGGYVGATPTAYSRYALFEGGHTVRPTGVDRAELLRFVRAKGVTVIALEGNVEPWLRLFGSLGIVPRNVGGVILYRLRSP